MTSELSPSILRPGKTCWRIAQATRASVLVDGAAYFAALRSALLKARRSVFIVGWDIDSRTRLIGKRPYGDDVAPAELGKLLAHLVERRPELRVHLLLWDYSVVYALDREPLPRVSLDWSTPPGIRVCLDDVLPLAASHHQKVVVVDDAVAFCGGMDLTTGRWDTPEHLPDNPDRIDPSGALYAPFHDVQMLVDGDAARALGELVRGRWQTAACERPMAIEPTGDPWPDALEPDFREVRVGIARTLPAIHDQPAKREVEALYLASIQAAERFIYIENQFLTADAVAEALARQLAQNPKLEVVIVNPATPDGWLEAKSMGAGRVRFMRRLADAGVADRVLLAYPEVSKEGAPHSVMVHAKLMVVDDVLLRVGSSNISNRSMGVDTECDLAVEASGPEDRKAIAEVRNRLLGEHLGLPPGDIAHALEAKESLLELIETRSDNWRTLRPIRDEGRFDDALAHAASQLADPERPTDPSSFVGDMFEGAPVASRAKRYLGPAVLVAVLIGLIALWRYTPLAEFADAERLAPAFEAIRSEGSWAFVIVPLAYIVAGLTAFPVTVLIVLTVLVFGAWSGFAYALSGSVISAAIGYQLGATIGNAFLRDLMGRRINRVSRMLARKGIVTVAAVRNLPIAPFTIINLVAGASHIGFGTFIVGTLLGMAPGIAVITGFTHQLNRVWQDPGLWSLCLLALAAAAWIGIAIGLQRMASRFHRN